MSFSQEHAYYLRCHVLLVQGGTLIVRKVFNQNVPNNDLRQFLGNNKKEIEHLKKKRVLTDPQYELLFPNDGGDPSAEKFDLTLLICLTNNFSGLPESVKADLRRLREFRNKLAHSTSASLDTTEFNQLWSEIEQVLHNLNDSVTGGIDDLGSIIAGYKTDAVDTETERKFEEQLISWQKMDHVLEEIEELSRNVKDLQTGQELLQQNINEKKGLSHEEMKQVLKEDLILFNDAEHSSVILSPVSDENDAPLLDLYVVPEMNAVDVGTSGYFSQIKKPVKSLQDIFMKNGKKCTDVYVTADAGLGKTSFSKRLAVAWCLAHKDKDEADKDKYSVLSISAEDIATMKDFDFLFFVPLRDSADCDVDEMILNQVIGQLSNSNRLMSKDFLQTILHNETCLVILDGLDEWQHPESSKCHQKQKGIPHRKNRKCCTVLTTSRPWKMSMIKLKTTEIQKQHQVELVGLSRKASDKLKMNAIKCIKNVEVEKLRQETDNFNKVVRMSDAWELEKNPQMLMYLICLWCDGRPFGRTKSELYENIVNFLLSRAEESYKRRQREENETYEQFGRTNGSYNDLMVALGQLAFYTLFGKTKEFQLTFDASEAENYLKEFVGFSLTSGIITQNKVRGLINSQRKVSFAHKTLQEYLAAFYLQNTFEKEMSIILTKCSSIPDVLEMAKVFIFLSGLSGNAVTLIMQNLQKAVAEDTLTLEHRRTATHWLYEWQIQPLKDVQDMNVACMHEAVPNSDLCLCLEDFLIDTNCRDSKYLTALQMLTQNSKGHIKSLSIEQEGISSLNEITEAFGLNSVQGLQKVYIRGECPEKEFASLAPGSEQSLISLAVISSEWKDSKFEEIYSVWSNTHSRMLSSFCHLQAINLDGFVVAHEDIRNVVLFLKQRPSLKELTLHNIKCSDHESNCSGEELYLTEHTGLEVIRLRNLPLSQVKLNVSPLKYCDVGHFQNPCIASSYLDQLQRAENLERIHCNSLESPEEIEKLMETLPYLVNMHYIVLRRLKTGTTPLSLPLEMKSLEYFQLFQMTVPSSVLQEFVDALTGYVQQVRVVLRDCTFTPADEFLSLKSFIAKDSQYVVIFDGESPPGTPLFSFDKKGIIAEGCSKYVRQDW